jgi:hypothetical protein
VKKGIGEIMGGQVLELESKALILLALRAQKNTVPAAIALSAKTVLSVRLQGFEPWTLT